jgi:predicted nuclease of predicted toxin-antitoxin system
VPAPRFLIDETLSVELPALAHAAGFEAQHVNRLGLSTKGDPVLMQRILDEDWPT